MKWLIRIVVAGVVLVVLVAVVGFWQMDRIATGFLQKAVAFATQCDTQVDAVDLSPFSGGAELEGLVIANPEPFQSVHEDFLDLKTGSVKADLSTLRADDVVIPELTIDEVRISLVGRDGKTNYETILESLARLKSEDPPKDEETGSKTFTIKKVTITNVVVDVDMDQDPALGLAPVKLDGLKLKPIELTDVGSGGVPLSQISADLIADILVQVVAQLGEQLGSRVLSGLTSGLSGMLGGSDQLQAQLTTIAADLNLSSTINVAEQLEVAEKLGTALEGVQELLPDAGNLGDRINNVIPGRSGGSEGEGEGDGEEEEESGGSIEDRIRGLGR